MTRMITVLVFGRLSTNVKSAQACVAFWDQMSINDALCIRMILHVSYGFLSRSEIFTEALAYHDVYIQSCRSSIWAPYSVLVRSLPVSELICSILK